MARYLNKGLAILDRLYKFVGGEFREPPVDLEGQVTVVHDISRQVEKQGWRGLGGFYRYQATLTHGAANTQRDVVTFAQIAAELGVGVQEISVWLCHSFGRPVDTDFDYAYVVRTSPGVGGLPTLGSGATGAATAQEVLLQFDEEIDGTTTVATTQYAARPVGVQLTPGPWPIFPGEGVGVVTTSAAAVTIYWHHILWIGPAGSSPPGAA